MATQSAFRFTKTLLNYSHVPERIVTLPRLSIDQLSSKLCVFNQTRDSSDDGKNVSNTRYRNHIRSPVLTGEFGLYSRSFNSRLLSSTGFTNVKKLLAQMTSSHSLCGCSRDFTRSFGTTECASSHVGIGGSDHEKSGTSHSASLKDWGLRLANENGYLSWCRNTYLTTVVALAIIEEGLTSFAEQAATGALVVAGLNMTWGTYQYVYNMIQLRHRTGMSFLGVLIYASLALLHLALWFVVCVLFMGYPEDPVMKAIEEEAERQSQAFGEKAERQS